MKQLLFAGLFAIALITLSATTIEKNNEDLTKDFVTGDLEIGSINQLSFGPQGILFIGDSKNAAIYALDTKDTEQTISAKGINIADFDDKIASAVGTTKENIKITDIKVTMLSHELKPEEYWATRDIVCWKTDSVLVEVFTDQGIVGIGGSSQYGSAYFATSRVGPDFVKQYIEEIIKSN